MGMIKEIFSRRDLIRELVAKNLKSRYCRPALGFLWAVLSPLALTGVFYFIFSMVLKIKTQEAPFFLYLMSAVFSWRFFQDAVFSSATSLVDNKNLLKEANFPHYLIPLSVVFAEVINFLPALAVLIITALLVLKALPVFIFLLPLVLIAHFIITFGIALISALLYIRWRDVRYVLDVVLPVIFYSTPVFYSLVLIKETFGNAVLTFYLFNPFVCILNLYRIAILKGFYPAISQDMHWAAMLAVVSVFSLGVFMLAAYLYKKGAKSINDYISY